MDHIDRLLAKWEAERPGEDFSPVRIIGRMARIMEHIDRALEETFSEFGISRATFDVLATLKREGPPYSLTQRALSTSLLRTSGSMSVRIDAMERAGFVRRDVRDDDRRSVIVTLTRSGHKVVENVVPAHLANESALLEALPAPDRSALEAVLTRWLASFEREDAHDNTRDIGVTLASARLSLMRRRAVGLPDVPGLLVDSVAPGTAADRAGIRKGDLVTAVGATAITSPGIFMRAVAQAVPKRKQLAIVRGATSMTVTLER